MDALDGRGPGGTVKDAEVPQQPAKAFMGRSKVLYAQGEDGRLHLVPSLGWEVEEIVLDQAIAEFDEAARAAAARFRRGEASALEVHMYHRRMDVMLLASATGFWQWQVRRHLRPGAWERLSQARRARYAEALGTSVEALGRLPEGL